MRNERRCGKFCRTTLAGWKRCLAGIAPIGARGSGERLNDVRNDSSLVKSNYKEEGSLGKIEPSPRRRAMTNSIPTLRQPSPYLTLRRKLIDEASGMYFAGQVISPMGWPSQMIWASI